MRKALFIVAPLAIASVLVGGVVFAAGMGPGGQGHAMGFGRGGGMMPGVFGTVSAINGTTLTVTQMGFGKNSSTTTEYTVNAASATVVKNGASSTVSAIASGDKVMVRGTVSGTNVTATEIYDGMTPGGPGGMRGRMWGSSSTPATPPFQGNGEPVVGGTVTAINGSTLTVTNKSNVTYSVDGSTATVVKGNVSSSLANVSVNDDVIIQGTVNGTSVTASSIIDQGVAPSGNASSTHPGAGQPGGFMGRVFGGIGGFFHHLFGFF